MFRQATISSHRCLTFLDIESITNSSWETWDFTFTYTKEFTSTFIISETQNLLRCDSPTGTLRYSWLMDIINEHLDGLWRMSNPYKLEASLGIESSTK
jgi:hypothetical protein